MTSDTDRFVTISEAARIVGCDRKVILLALNEGSFPIHVFEEGERACVELSDTLAFKKRFLQFLRDEKRQRVPRDNDGESRS